MEIINLLGQEHMRVMSMFDRLDSLGAVSAKEQIVLQLVQELSMHEEAEEVTLWAELRKATSHGVNLDTAIQQEVELKQLLAELAREMGNAKLLDRVTQLREMLTRHVQLEERELFPLVQKSLDEARRNELGEAYMRAKTAETEHMAKLNVIMAPESPVDQAQRT